MVAEEVISLFTNFRGAGQVGVLDLADKLNTLVTIQVILICGLIVTVKQYVQNPLSCYTATPFSGGSIDKYVNNYCWVEGTIPLSVAEAISIDNEKWAEYAKKRIVYYQWVPFFLALQGILFLLPRFIWMVLTYNRTGTDLDQLIRVAADAASDDPGEQEGKIIRIVATIRDSLLASREIHRGCWAQVRRWAYDLVGLTLLSKRMGTRAVAAYLLMKMSYLALSVGQLYMMQHFIGLRRNGTASFGWELAQKMVSGKDWRQTEMFPRVAFCRVPIVQVGAINKQTSQCVLGANFVNEKIFIFLWFWLVMLSILTAASIPVWFIRLSISGSRESWVRRRLAIAGVLSPRERKLVAPFARLFLRHDGVFVLRMLGLNAGDYITGQVTLRLFHLYENRLADQDFFVASEEDEDTVWERARRPIEHGEAINQTEC